MLFKVSQRTLYRPCITRSSLGSQRPSSRPVVTCSKHTAARQVDELKRLVFKVWNYLVPQAIDLKEFMKAFDMPDTFFSWFLVTELHVWLLGARLMQVD